MEIRGYVEDIRAALEEFDIFGYPLIEDTYATSEKALQEAMWAGIPPVVFAHGGVRCLVEHERTGLVVETEDEYARAIERLAGDPDLRRRLGDEARRFIRAAFDPARWQAANRGNPVGHDGGAPPRSPAATRRRRLRRVEFRAQPRRPGRSVRG